MRLRFDDARDRVAAGPTQPEPLRFPPVLPRRQLESTGYLKSFPHLAGTVFAFEGDEAQAAEQAERARARTRTGASSRRMTDLVLTPAACYPVYPAVARARAARRRAASIVDAGGSYVFRHEPSGDPARLQMFHQRELVRIGEPEAVAAWRDALARPRARAAARRSGSTREFDVATDPFFGRSGRMLAASQREQALKFEILVPIAGPEPTAVASFNYHQDHFASRPTASTLADGGVAHTACLGFGARADHARAASRRTASTSTRWPGASARGAWGRDDRAPTPGSSACFGLDPATYRPHALHAGERTYRETNCYTDVLIELLHARGDEPLAALGSHRAHGLRGRPVDVLQAAARATWSCSSGSTSTRCSPTGRCPRQIAEQLAAGRTLIVELDSWYLPDTAATSYRDRARQDARSPSRRSTATASGCATSTTPGCYELDGERLPGRRSALGGGSADDVLPPYTELVAVRRRAAARRRGAARRGARAAAPSTSTRVRPANPVRALRRAARRAICRAARRATPPTTTPTRSRRSAWSAPAFEIGASHVDWLLGAAATSAAAALRRIVDGSKVLSFKLARRRPFDPEPAIDALAAAWDEAMTRLDDGAPLRPCPRQPLTVDQPGRTWCRRWTRDGSAAAAPPDAHAGSRGARRLDWQPAAVPGTAAGVLRDRPVAMRRPGRSRRGGLVVSHRFDADAGGTRRGGRAAARRASPPSPRSTSTASACSRARRCSQAHDGRGRNAVCAATTSWSSAVARSRRCCAQRRRPRARWRTRLVERQPALLPHDAARPRCRDSRPGPAAGRAVAPGLARAPARHASWTHLRAAAARRRRRRRGSSVAGLRACHRRGRRRGTGSSWRSTAPPGRRACRSSDRGGGGASSPASSRVPDVERWWPHTHGTPALHDVGLRRDRAGEPVGDRRRGRVGFRSLAAGPDADHDLERDGLDLHVNGVRVFAAGRSGRRSTTSASRRPGSALRATLEQVRDAGMNMLRVPGTGAYEEPRFHDLCDELGHPRLAGLHVRQPRLPVRRRRSSARSVEARGAWRCSSELGRPPEPGRRVRQQRGRAAGRRCSGSTRTLGRGELFGELLPGARRARRAPTRVYVPSAPCGGDLPFRPDAGVANYFGVGGYRRPLEDARRAGVRFASECLAFANVPDDERARAAAAGGAGPLVHHPRWKAGRAARRRAPAGTSTTSATTTSRLLFGVDPAELPRADHDALPRALPDRSRGEVMAEVFGEWRRGASPCGGGLVLWLRDLVPGAGWGADRRRAATRRSPTTTSGARSRPSRSGRPTRGSTASPSTSPTTGPSRSRRSCA